MAYEASEIMTAAALQYTTKELVDIAHQGKDAIIELIESTRKQILAGKTKIHFGNEAIKKGFVELMTAGNAGDMAVAMSAATGIRKYMDISFNEIPDVFMTGNVWPEEVEIFKVSAYGFEDYNSADVLATADAETYYGISLKKKRSSGGGEPTLINKAFDTVLQGKQFDSIKDELVKIRQDYFADLVIEAVDRGLILKSHIKDFDRLRTSPSGKKELFEAKQRDKKLFDRSYIDTKGSAMMKDGYKADKTNDPNSMRYFVNKKLSEKNNPLWKEFIAVMNDHADLFADSLINIILKTKLFDELEAKDLGKYKFIFFLVTGVGDVTSKGEVRVGQATVIPLKTTLCGLTRIQEKFKNKKYEIVLDEQKMKTSDAAKIFLQLKKGNVTLLDLEIRYKGAFTPQPQFQGTLNPEFKKLLEQECGL